MVQELGRIAGAVGDRFRVQRRLGVGGMASVYLAEDLRHHRSVAIKVLEADVGEAVDAERFEREIDTIAGLHHPHILPLHDSGRAEGLLYFVMPWVEEGTLRDRLAREGPLPLGEALRLGREVAEALAYAHAQGIVHRDVKPENIMLDSGHAVVSDFGIAVLVGGAPEDRITRRGLSPGTPEYMSPEQGEGARADPRSDVYSLGCVLYEMLAGDPPFTGSSRQAILARKLVDPVPPLRSVRPGVPEAVEREVVRALERVPADRHRSAAELGERLARLESEARRQEAVTLVDVGSPGRLAAVAALVVAGGALLLTAIGMLATRVLDYKIQMPPPHMPSRGDYLVVGAQALIPFVVYGLLALGAGLVLGRWVVPLTVRITARASAVGSARPGRWARLAPAWPAGALADLFLFGMVAVSALALWPFGAIYQELGQPGGAPSSVLSCASRALHNAHYLVMPALVVALAAARHALIRRLRRRRPDGAGWAVFRWASAAWLVVLVVVAALPWRVLWDAYYERALIGGERAYVVAEEEGELLAYTPASRSVRVHPAGSVDVERRGVVGYLFEEPDVFTSPLPRCTAIWSSAP